MSEPMIDHAHLAAHWLEDLGPSCEPRRPELSIAHALLAIHDEVRALREALTSPERGQEATESDAGAEDVSVEGVYDVTIKGVFAHREPDGFLRINVGPATAVIDDKASNVEVRPADPADALAPLRPVGRPARAYRRT